MIEEDAEVNAANPNVNSGSSNSFIVGSVSSQRTTFLRTPALSGEIVQDLQLCLYKSQGDTNKDISIYIVNEEWHESNITWSESEARGLVSSEVIWSGAIINQDEEMRCLTIDDSHINTVNAAKGVALYYDDPIESWFMFTSSEGCAAESNNFLFCPHWRYKTELDAGVTSVAFPQQDTAVTSSNPGSNFGLDNSYIVSRSSNAMSHILINGLDVSGSAVENLQLCLYKSAGDTDKRISIHNVNEYFHEMGVTWFDAAEEKMISSEIIWSGIIQASDREPQCLSIDESQYQKISFGYGVALMWDDAEDSFMTFSSSESCADQLTAGNLITWRCPHWRYDLALLPSLTPTTPPSLLPTKYSTGSPTASPNNSPTNSTSQPLSTDFLDKWKIGETQFTGLNDVLNGKVKVQNEIGPFVNPGNVDLHLFDFTCQISKNTSGLEVVLESESYTTSPFKYNFTIDQSLIVSTPGGFVTFIDDSNNTGFSRGMIQFCTCVSTREASITVSFRYTQFTLRFDLSENVFSVSDIEIEMNAFDSIDTIIDDSFGVGACQCDSNFDCYDQGTSPIIKQNELLEVCLFPTAGSNGDATFVHISNFNLRMTAGEEIFDAVDFGLETWSPSSLAVVTTQENTDRIKVLTPVVGQFYIQGFNTVNITGEAFLEFDSLPSKRSESSFRGYLTTVGIEIESSVGCLKNLINQFLKI